MTDQPNERHGNDGDSRVIPLRRRTRMPPARVSNAVDPSGRSQAPPDLARYERIGEDDDYRHRMIVNGAALVFTIVLALAGTWLASKMADLRKNQDCVLAGRSNCAHIDVPRTGQ